ncbi:MAG: glutathione peroxidase [Gammaproteobacteria bacterium]|nr:glutathione peroxidase [Gammaproteobacteria bacterium]
MKKILFKCVLAAIFLPVAVYAGDKDCAASLDVEKRYLNKNQTVRLCEEFKDNVVLIVNTASKCGFTNQYDGLETLYRRYRNQGFVVLGFPSNDFGGQEPGSEEEIAQFCRLTYSIEFPMFEKTDVAQDRAGVLYSALAKETGQWPQWNFHKYLLDRNGNVVSSFPSQTKPQSDELVSAIESLL